MTISTVLIITGLLLAIAWTWEALRHGIQR